MKFSLVCLLLSLAFFSVLLSRCSKPGSVTPAKHDLHIYPSSAITQQLSKPLQSIISQLQALPDRGAAFADVVKRVGTPYWGKCLQGQRLNTFVCLLPIKRDQDTLFTAFVAIEADTCIRFQVYERQDLLIGGIDQPGGPSSAEINHAFNALNHFGFGQAVYTTKGISSKQLQMLRPYQLRHQGDSLQSSRFDVHAQSITSCYSWSTCMGDGYGNCVGTVYNFTECVTETFWVTSSSNGYGSGGNVFDEPPVHGGSGGGTSNNGFSRSDLEGVQVINPKTPIVEPELHLACFDTTLSAKLTVYVDQPMPGTTDPFSIFGGIGHTYLGLEQVVNGQTIVRTIGFYPETVVNPLRRKASNSILGDDAGRDYNIKWETTISGPQLAGVIAAVVHYAGTYHIEDYNCANFVLDVAAAGGINLPRTKGWWYVGRGLNPGALGEDLRKLPGADRHGGVGPASTGDCR